MCFKTSKTHGIPFLYLILSPTFYMQNYKYARKIGATTFWLYLCLFSKLGQAFGALSVELN